MTTTRIVKLRADRELTKRGGYGVDRLLPSRNSNEAVYWKDGDSYVASKDSHGDYVIFSITGVGEIRWDVRPLEWHPRNLDVIDYFFERGTEERA